MSKKETCERRTEELLQPILSEAGFELVDVEYVKEAGNYYLRAYIDKPGGITIDDCEAVSRRLSDLLDEEDFIEESYILEISSPGLGRILKKDRDLERSTGKEVEVRLYAPKNGSKELTGVLAGWDADTYTIRTEEEELVLERSAVAVIREAFDF